MFTTQFWLIVIGIAQMIGCSWIFSKFQKRAYKREIRSRHSYVLLAKLLAEEDKLRCNISKCNEDGTGEVYLGLSEGIVKVSICSHCSNGTWVMGFLPNASSASIVSATITSWAKDNCPKKAKTIVIKPNLKYLFVFMSFIFLFLLHFLHFLSPHCL
jgi:hypothetical protein